MKREIIMTEDGSRTLHLPELNEHYHSIHGARSESEYVFLQQGLVRRLQATSNSSSLRLLEVGFGTGLNALVTLLHYCTHRFATPLHYLTYELYPLEWNMIQELFEDILTEDEQKMLEEIHFAEWGKAVKITDQFTLEKRHQDILTAEWEEQMWDIIYLDPFAPEKAPEMWTSSFFQQLYNASRPDAVLSTYCAKGVVRRGLQEVGFTVHRTPGPPNGKREILVAIRP